MTLTRGVMPEYHSLSCFFYTPSEGIATISFRFLAIDTHFPGRGIPPQSYGNLF